MAILLHTCCGPCLSGSYPLLEPIAGPGNTALLWENPNIHPFVEFRSRQASFIKMAEILGLQVIAGDTEYGLERFLSEIAGEHGPARCATCYRMRLTAAARAAARLSFEAFTTTLLISPYQNHELLIATGEEAARQTGVKFHYTDFRPGFRQSHELARQHELYRQKYCGCIFSEQERFGNDKRYLNPFRENCVKIDTGSETGVKS
ncbi:MAG TPA: epoxyqueuosine reductase QueH [Candidatus Rifleibacterium sp.]|nr:epoxyqueuosine reductase QueH [Candidatus Rifleibacterium sp.]HPT45194.1 epoxyqueuosine reductase QueH [Candidatus Rifleibacterium sp.]